MCYTPGSAWQGIHSGLFHKMKASVLIPIPLFCGSVTTEARFLGCFLLTFHIVVEYREFCTHHSWHTHLASLSGTYIVILHMQNTAFNSFTRAFVIQLCVNTKQFRNYMAFSKCASKVSMQFLKMLDCIYLPAHNIGSGFMTWKRFSPFPALIHRHFHSNPCFFCLSIQKWVLNNC